MARKIVMDYSRNHCRNLKPNENENADAELKKKNDLIGSNRLFWKF